MFFTLFECSVRGGGGSPKGWVHNLLLQFFTLGSSKIEVFETYFFDTMLTYNDHPSYVKHVLGHTYMFFTLFGHWGGLPKDWSTTCLCSFSPWAAQKSKFSKLIFLIPCSHKMTLQGM